MNPDLIDAAVSLVEVIAQENDALRSFDLRHAASLTDSKARAIEAFISAQAKQDRSKTISPTQREAVVEMAARLRPCRLAWLEEPVWPPEDREGLARVRRAADVPIAAGENAAGLHEFRALFAAGALDIAQPSVAKIGGITEVLKIAALAEAHGVRLVPHCAYFGPGFLASLHLAAAVAPAAPFERLFVTLEANPYHELVLAPGGRVMIPDAPGLGRDPDPEILRRYAMAAPVVLRS